MKNILLMLILSAFPFSVSHAQTFSWAKSFGSSGGFEFGRSNFVDAAGNVYTTGNFYSTVDFDPGAGVFNLTSGGDYDIYVQKLDANGNFLWAVSMGSTQADYGHSIVVDALGNVYTTGYFYGTVDFDPGAAVVNLTSIANNVFVQKLDASGNFVWAKSVGGGGDDKAYSIKIDAGNNLYITGLFSATVDFDPGAGTYNLVSSGSSDIFVLKLNAAGNFQFARQFGGTGADIGNSICLDASGNIYLTGTFSGTADFDPNVGVFNLISSGGTDIFVVKLSSLATLFWAKSVGGTAADISRSIDLDASNNVFLTGTYSGTVDFDPSGGTINLVSQGVLDVFILKLDNSGNYSWAKSIGGTANEDSNSICVDQYGCVYITGVFQGNVDFDPGPDFYNILASSYDIFIAKLNSAGDFKWAGEIGTTAQSVGVSIVRDASQNLYITGGYGGPADFNIGPGVFNMTGVTFDVFVLKMIGCTPSAGTDVQYACDSLTWIDGVTYYASNNSVTYVLTNSTGCDSVVTLNLTLHQSDSVTDVQIACDNLTWIDGNNYTSTNNSAIHTLTNIFGCDSVVSLDLTIVNSSSSTDTQTACNSFVWMDGNNYTASNTTATYITTNSVGCDSIITLNLTINLSDNTSDVQAHCDSYLWTDGNTYTSSNNSATQTLTNMFGCDSVVTLDLTIEISPIANATNAGDGTLVGSGGDTYQWIDCGTYLPVIGATSATFVPLTNGDYSVVASTALCSDTSGCANYNSVGLMETSNLHVSIYPNPTEDLIIIKSQKTISGSIIIRDNSGRIIVQTPIHSNETVVDLSHLESGIYFITILDTSSLQTTKKVIKM